MNPIRKLAGQTAIYGIPSILGRFLNYLLVPLYTYGLLTTQEYGVVNLFYSYAALIMVMLTYGMETAFFRFSETEKERTTVYGTATFSLLFSSIAFLLLTTLLSAQIARWIDYDDYPHFVIWFAWIMALDAAAAIPFAKLRSDNRPVWFATVKTVNILTNIFFNLFFLLACPYLDANWQGTEAGNLLRIIYRPDWVMEYIFISNLIASIVTVVLLLPEFRLLRRKVDPGILRRMLVFGLPLMVAGMAGIINETIDRILLRYLLPLDPAEAEAQVGIYSACYKIAVLMVLFIQAYRFAAEPFFFSKMKDKDAKTMYVKVMDYFIIAVTLIFLVTMVFLDTIFIRFTGPAFREARAVIPVLMLAKLFLGVYYNLSIWFKITGKTLWGALITGVGAIVTITLNVILIPLPDSWLIHGYLGAAFATLACYATMMTMGYFLGQKYYPVDYNLKKFFLYTSVVLLLFGLYEWLKPASFFAGLAFGTVITAIYLLLIIRVERPGVLKIR